MAVQSNQRSCGKIMLYLLQHMCVISVYVNVQFSDINLNASNDTEQLNVYVFDAVLKAE